MAAIHEDDIKRIALGFLRSYYKHRPRSGDMHTETNMRGEGGIVVDSYLSYTDENGEQFIATAEATSVDTRDEVKYTLQHRLLLWDSLVFGVLIGLLYVIVTYFFRTFSIPGLPLGLRIVSIVLVIISLTIFYQQLIRPLRRYRYIYAIAQFKKYHADEQWVALAKGVFPSLDDNTYYRELKRQCTRFGFGLILVDNQLHPRLVLSPAREEQFDKRREEVRLLSEKNYARLQKLSRQDWWIIRQWNQWSNPYREHDYLRYKRGFRNQLALIGLGLVLIILVLLQENKRVPIYYPNESRYLRQLEQKARQLQEEKNIRDPRPYVVPYGDSFTQERIIGMELNEDTAEVVPIKPTGEVMIYDPFNQTIILYDCERMYNFYDTKYIIEIGAYDNQPTARTDLEILGDAGIQAVVFWEGCFSPNQGAFIMYAEQMHNSRQDAQIALDSLENKLTAVGLLPRIRPITPVIGGRD